MVVFSRYFAARPGRRATPQSQPIPGTAQVPNSAGGHACALGPWKRLDRFLVLAALKTYAQGRGVRGKNRWDPVAPQLISDFSR